MAISSLEFLMAAAAVAAFASFALSAEKEMALDANAWGRRIAAENSDYACTAATNLYYANAGGELMQDSACPSLGKSQPLLAEIFYDGGKIRVKVEKHYGREQ